MAIGYVVIGLTAGTRATSEVALKAASDAIRARFMLSPIATPRFTGYVTSRQPGIVMARYEAEIG